MAKKRNKIIVKTNLDTATSQQKEKFIELLVQAHNILFQSVVNTHLEAKTRF